MQPSDAQLAKLTTEERGAIKAIITAFRELIFVLQEAKDPFAKLVFITAVESLTLQYSADYAHHLQTNWQTADPSLVSKVKTKYADMATQYYNYVMRTLGDPSFSHTPLLHLPTIRTPFQCYSGSISRVTSEKLAACQQTLLSTCRTYTQSAPMATATTSIARRTITYGTNGSGDDAAEMNDFAAGGEPPTSENRSNHGVARAQSALRSACGAFSSTLGRLENGGRATQPGAAANLLAAAREFDGASHMACDGPGDATDHRNDNDDDVTPTRCCCFG